MDTIGFEAEAEAQANRNENYNDLKGHEEHGKLLAVGKQTVIAYVSRRKKEMCNKSQNTAMYGLHPMCYAQVDFGEVLLKARNGAEEKMSELIVSFPFSNAGFRANAYGIFNKNTSNKMSIL